MKTTNMNVKLFLRKARAIRGLYEDKKGVRRSR